MKRHLLVTALAGLLATMSFARTAQTSPASYVNPMVGTDFTGHTFPGAVWPFGMVQLSPDTRPRSGDWDGCSGYHYSDSLIYGFSHTHLSGTGCDDLCDVLVMPVRNYDSETLERNAYASPFSHSRETASAGFYAVYLDAPAVTARLSVGRRSGYHEYIFEKGAVPQIIIDLNHRDVLLDSYISFYPFAERTEQTVTAEGEGRTVICGRRRSSSWSQDQDLYFYMEFSVPIARMKNFGDRGALLEFERGSTHRNGQMVGVRVGISSVSVENARGNLLADGYRNLDQAHKAALAAWNAYLGKIEVTSADTERLRTFYTAMYHSAIHPSLYSDYNGEYRGMDREVHRAEGFERYHIFSLWDTFRALHPLFTIIERERTKDFLKTFQSIYDECGKLPIWELSGYETNCMIGYNSVSVIADALAKGIDFDAERMLEAMVASAKKHEYGLDSFYANGGILADDEHESVSKTLEYAYDAWCVSRVAQMLLQKHPGNAEYAATAAEFRRYATYWANSFDASTGFMRARLNGRWQTPFDPREVNNHFTEANSWQYSFFVPQDVQRHIVLLGGDEAYCDKIDALFSAQSRTSGRTQVDITGLIGQYAHGNEPSHHVAYLYSYAGKPWKTQKQVREILTTLYDDSPDGLCGNDDCGQMSAWYVMSAAGLYSVTPGSTQLVLGSPLFSEVKWNLEDGRSFVISARTPEGQALDDCPYISGATLGGVPYTRSYLEFSDIISGGRLQLSMSPVPDESFGSEKKDRPQSCIGETAVENPVFILDNDMFEDSVQVSIANIPSGGRALYRIGEGEPVEYSGPFTLTRSAALEAWNEDEFSLPSFKVQCSVHKLHSDRKVSIGGHYNPQYNAGGDDGLIDGRRGKLNWRTGGWQGYQGEDFEAVVDLLEIRELHKVGAGFCQDARSWIWMPREVEFYLSEDGENYTLLSRMENSVDPRDYEIQVQDFEAECPTGTSARYVKVKAAQLGTIPDWHPGAGGQSFIFIDEIWAD